MSSQIRCYSDKNGIWIKYSLDRCKMDRSTGIYAEIDFEKTNEP